MDENFLNIRSWGYRPPRKQKVATPRWVPKSLETECDSSLLAYGRGRSYGDSCINSEGLLIRTEALNRFKSFDVSTGVLVAEPGVQLSEILDLIVPKGWFFPVCPGTSFVTLGGAVSNDIHGKNHHKDGTLGRHVLSLNLLRSNGDHLKCSMTKNRNVFVATIGGLGLTGLITEITIQLVRVKSSYLDVRYDLFENLDEFVKLSEKHKNQYQYTVAWLDCANSGRRFSRGVFMSANHSEINDLQVASGARKRFNLNVPFNFPSRILNKYSIRVFNNLYFNFHRKLHQKTIKTDFRKFFFPLDGVKNWNRIYGGDGFHQYQFVIPHDKLSALEEILIVIVRSGMGSFLAVLKEFGSIESPGLLSFPRAGWCLALDFSNRGNKTSALLDTINNIVMAAGGAVYPAKDRVMSQATFNQSFSKLPEFLSYKDERFSSDFWRRVHG